MVGIAQLVERLVVVQEVAGSSPVTHPKSIQSIFPPFLNIHSLNPVVFEGAQYATRNV